jgi:hypothetical protein
MLQIVKLQSPIENNLIAEVRLKALLEASLEEPIFLNWHFYDQGQGVLQSQTYQNHLFIGQINYRIRGDTLALDYAFTSIQFENRGVGAIMLAGIVDRHPNVRQISASLTQDNLAALREKIDDGLTCEAALKLTPVYRAAARSGFTELVSPNCHMGSIRITRSLAP